MSGAPPSLTLFLCGDVMAGRGVDQVLPSRCPPGLHEPLVRSALEYVALAERANGPIPRPLRYAELWGDALVELDRRRPDVRIVNLETSITTSEDAEPKGINYRMHPANVALLAAARIDCCALANNHVLDWGVAGLHETLAVLAGVGIRSAGAGRHLGEAQAPAVVPLREGARVLVFGFGTLDSGIPPAWAAGPARPGVHLLPDLSARTVDHVARLVGAVRRAADVVVASIHWGSNWGHAIPAAHRRFARGLIERAGVDVVHGHSSHHPRAIEIHHGRPILYGCGDLINDYEGIGGWDDHRKEIVAAYFATLDRRGGRLLALELVPFRLRRFRPWYASPAERRWLHETLDRVCRALGTRVVARGDALAVLPA